MKVDYIIIGGQKCGTTALHYFLSKHPKIVSSKPKEIDFFNYDLNYSRGFSYYHSFFKHRPKFATPRGFKFLEASPSYGNGSLYCDISVTAKRIYAYNQDARLIFVVRNPVERAYSAWNMFKLRYEKGNIEWWYDWFEARIGYRPDAVRREYWEFLDFDRFIRNEIEHLQRGRNIECPCLPNGKYIDYLTPFQEVFKERLMVATKEALELETAKTLNDISAFLRLPKFNWSFLEGERKFDGDYEEPISEDIKKTLQNYYRGSNILLRDLTGIDYCE